MNLVEALDQISVEDLVRLVASWHHNPSDVVEGDLAHRLYRFRTYRLATLPIALLDLHEWSVDDELVADYAALKTPAPPIVYDPLSHSIIDGTHRANAAAVRGEQTIDAYVGAEIDPDWDENEMIDECSLPYHQPTDTNCREQE